MYRSILWDLPTGSHIAVLHVPAQGVPKATPLILVHGGPGTFEVIATGTAYYGARRSATPVDLRFSSGSGGHRPLWSGRGRSGLVARRVRERYC